MYDCRYYVRIYVFSESFPGQRAPSKGKGVLYSSTMDNILLRHDISAVGYLARKHNITVMRL